MWHISLCFVFVVDDHIGRWRFLWLWRCWSLEEGSLLSETHTHNRKQRRWRGQTHTSTNHFASIHHHSGLKIKQSRFYQSADFTKYGSNGSATLKFQNMLRTITYTPLWTAALNLALVHKKTKSHEVRNNNCFFHWLNRLTGSRTNQLVSILTGCQFRIWTPPTLYNSLKQCAICGFWKWEWGRSCRCCDCRVPFLIVMEPPTKTIRSGMWKQFDVIAHHKVGVLLAI